MDPFWLEYTDSLYRYAVRLTGDRDEARDLVQETFLRFIGKGRVPRPDANVKAYLFTVLRHLWYRERRRQRDRRRVLLRLFRRYPVEGGEPEGLSELQRLLGGLCFRLPPADPPLHGQEIGPAGSYRALA